jgi:DNA repair photolyase
MITKNHLVTRDVDHLGELAQFDAASVAVSITTLDPKLANIMEPRASTPELRLNAIETLAKNGIPVTVMVAPLIPAINEHELPKILEAARDSGASFAGFVVLRLPWAVAPLFERWLEEHFPDRKEKVLNRIRELRGGALYEAQWGVRGRGRGVFAQQIEAIFDVTCRRLGINEREWHLSAAAFRRRGAQASLFQ